MTGSFAVIAMPTNKPPYQLAFQQVVGVPLNPDDTKLATSLGLDVALITRMAKSLYGKDFYNNESYRAHYNSLLAAARVGVEHPTGNIALGTLSEESARDEIIIDLGRKIRSRYLSQIGIISIVGFTIAAIIIYILSVFPTLISHTHVDDAYIVSFAYILVGLSLALWLGAALFLQKLTWSKFDFLDPDGFSPLIRTMIVIALAVLMMIMLDNKVIILGIGSIVLNNFKESPGVSLLLGALCALSQVQVIQIVRTVFDKPSVVPHSNDRGS